jgi:hypothetical protein
MATPTQAVFVTRFPQFGGQDTHIIQACLGQANREVSANVWDDDDEREDSVYWLTAHLIAIQVREIGMMVGAVQAKQYQSGANLGEELVPFHLAPYATTLYGREFMRRETSRLPATIGFVV